MPNIAVVGAQWGDEGKGKIVDWLSERADVIARFQGGHNAGHTLVIDGTVYMHTVTISDCVDTTAVHAQNSNLSIWWTTFKDVDNDGLRLLMDGLPAGDDRAVSIFHSGMRRVGGNGIRSRPLRNIVSR